MHYLIVIHILCYMTHLLSTINGTVCLYIYIWLYLLLLWIYLSSEILVAQDICTATVYQLIDELNYRLLVNGYAVASFF